LPQQLLRFLRLFETRLFVVVWLIYALHVVPGGGANPNRYFDLTHSIVNQRTTAIDAYHENTIDKAWRAGHFYPLGVPGPAVVGIPSYLLFKVAYKAMPASLLKPLANVQSFKQGQVGGFYQQDNTEFFLSTIWITWLTLSLLSALAAVVLFKVLLRLRIARSNALLATFGYTFGTPVFFYSTTYFSAAFAASFTIFALYFLLRLSPQPRKLNLSLLGLITGTTVLMEYQGLFLAAGISIYLLVRFGPRMAPAFFAGAAIPCAILLTYNTLAFGGPFHSAYQFVIGPNAEFHNVGALGFTVPRLGSLWGLTFATHRGLFLYAPILLLAPIGFALALRDRNQPIKAVAWISVLASIAVWLWISSFSAWDGSIAFGPRLLVAILPFMIIGVGWSLAKVPKFVAVPLVVLSIVLNWLGAQTGFAENVWEPWQRFVTNGFTLPAISALTSHARGANALVALASEHMWLIAATYALLILGCCLLLKGRTGRSGKVITEKLVPGKI
jgi:hypothetical protein